MSEDRIPFRIQSDGALSRAFFDGQDISSHLTGVRFNVHAGDAPSVQLELAAAKYGVIAELEIEPENVHLPQWLPELLVRLGWTPPKEAT